MVDYRIEITDDEGTRLPPILFNDADNLDFEALRVTSEMLGKASNVLRAHLLSGGEPAHSTRVIFWRGEGEPDQPTDDALPEGWGDEPGTGEGHTWTSSADYKGGTRIGAWSVKARIT